MTVINHLHSSSDVHSGRVGHNSGLKLLMQKHFYLKLLLGDLLLRLFCMYVNKAY
jgi:hypothetical protein